MQPPQEKIKKSKNFNASLVAGVIILLIIVGVGGWLVHRASSTDQVYKYHNLDSYTVGDSKPSITFNKPVELKQISKTQDEAELQHTIKTSGSHRGVATYIATAFVTTNVSASQEQIQSINETLQKPNTPTYSTYTRNIITFINARTATGWKNNLIPPKRFTNYNLKSGAWIFNFTSSYQNLIDKGQILYIVDGRINYYFLIESTNKNWDYNQQLWPQILNSIKISSLT